MSLFGINVYESELATKVEWYVQRHPIRKRRRNYRVAQRRVPCIFQTPAGFYVHPSLMAKLRQATRAKP